MIENQTTFRDIKKMKAMRILGVLAGAAMLAACGGGSSSGGIGGDGGRASLTITATTAQVQANPQEFGARPDSPHTTEVRVRFRQANGGNVPDGSTVTLSSSSSAIGVVAPIASPDAAGSSASSPTAGGVASFWFNAGRQTGTVTLTASAANPSGGPALSATFQITVVPHDGTGPDRIEITIADSELPANVLELVPASNSMFSTQVTVRVRSVNGDPAPNGTEVFLGVDNSSRAVVSPIEEPLAAGGSAVSEVAAGAARFLLTSQERPGPVVLSASFTDVDDRVVESAPVTFNILPNQQDQGRLRIRGSSTMPTNTQDVPPFFGSPFLNELVIEYIGPDGNPGQATELTFPDDNDYEGIVVSISPVTLGTYTTLTGAGLTFGQRYGSGPVLMNAGTSSVFILSDGRPGTVTLSAMIIDRDTNERFSAAFDVEIIDGAADFLPAQLDMSVSPEPIYVQGSGGATVKPMQLVVSDSGGNAVPNPDADGVSWNNVLLTLEAPAGSGARLTGTGVDGPVSGTEIAVRTVSGIANFSLSSGSATGPHRVIARVDRSDNNVDNGLLDPLQAEKTVEVGDGQLFSLTLVSPILNAIRVNPTTTGIETSFDVVLDELTGALIPSDPDGTYSLTVTVQGTDKVGNPVLPGTVVNFGKIDDPVSQMPPRFFIFSGPDGNPQEGGTLFSVWDPAEGFLDDPLRPDEAVEPGDTVALFGKSVPGNREHEAVRFVESVVDDRTVRVTQPWNPNNQTGSIVDDGYVIPWAIGRSRIGTIDQSVTLGAAGRGSVQLTYPINALGRPLVLWSQGSRVEPGGNKTVADVGATVFPGVAPLLLTASPSAIPANSTTPVRLCLTDGLGSPIEGAFITGGIVEGNATGQLDGVPMVTTTERATGTDGLGCVTTLVSTSGLVPEDEEALIRFSFLEAEAEVSIIPPGAAALLVQPSRAVDASLNLAPLTVTLTLISGTGEPISGVSLVGECDGGDGQLVLEVPPGVTNVNGQTTATVLLGLTACGDGTTEGWPRVGQCEFTTLTGEPVGLFTGIGNDARTFPTSPTPFCPPLPDEQTETGRLSVAVEDNRAPGSSSLIESIPTGIACDASGSGSNCQSDFSAGTDVLLRAPTGTSPDWIGDCQVSADPRFAQVSIAAGSNRTCQVVFN